MWIVARVKLNQLSNFKEQLKKYLDEEVVFYQPCAAYNIPNRKTGKEKILKKFVLGSYVFCKHDLFKDKTTLQQLKFIKGLDYFLSGFLDNQVEILEFINYCKHNEDSYGYLKQSFFSNLTTTTAKFISGPFSNMVFKIISKQKNKLGVLLRDKKVILDKKSEYLFYPV
tara:strand:+ start:23 stop:529 length:507 start_codon:yes stop_codon:yes gene_type:complete